MNRSGSSLGCARWNLPDVARSQGAQCLVEDKHLRKCVISGGSTIVGTRDNNESTSFITLSQNLKFDQQKFCEKQDAINYVNKYKPQQYGLSRIVAQVLSNQFSTGTLTYAT